MKHAGIHWPENAGGEHPDPVTILGMPGIRQGCTLICAPSARYWYSACRAASPLVVWRAIPRVGKRPAELGWDARKVAQECLNLWDEQPHGGNGVGEWFLPLNELQFEKENGGPFPGYAEMAKNLGRLRVELRRQLPGVSLMFPAWVPSDDGDHLDEWRHEAEQWDAICVHCYGSAGAMYERYVSYRSAFPDRPLMVGEWNANHEGHDEHAALEMWAGVSNADAGYMGSTYYIWETRNPGEHDLSIWGNDERLALFRSPPVIEAPEPEPIPEPIPEPEPPMPEPPRGVDVASYQGYPDWAAVAAAGYTFAITKATEDTGYVNPTFAHNWAGIKAAGLYRGAYHFARPSINDAVSEADYFVGLVEQHGIETGDILALDLEAGVGDLGPWVLAFCRRIEERCGFPPIIYTGAWFSGPHNLAAYPEIGHYGLWLAAYQAQMPAPPPPWSTVAFWQYSSSGTVPGIVGDVDVNVFNGPAGRIALYGKPAPAEPVPDPSAWVVGPGILAAMAAHGDQPASDEVYAAPDRAWSEAFGVSGSRYVWVPSLGRVTRFDPAA